MSERRKLFVIEYDDTKTTPSRIIHGVAIIEGVLKVKVNRNKVG